MWLKSDLKGKNYTPLHIYLNLFSQELQKTYNINSVIREGLWGVRIFSLDVAS